MMASFKDMVQAASADVRTRNLETIRQYNELLAANGIDAEVKVAQNLHGACVEVIGWDERTNRHEGYYVQGGLDEHPETLVWQIKKTLGYLCISVCNL